MMGFKKKHSQIEGGDGELVGRDRLLRPDMIQDRLLRFNIRSIRMRTVSQLPKR